MREELIQKLSKITPEEQAILDRLRMDAREEALHPETRSFESVNSAGYRPSHEEENMTAETKKNVSLNNSRDKNRASIKNSAAGDSSGFVRRELYTSEKDFIVDSRKLLERGRLIDLRPNTRFVHFPVHRHNYVEMLYVLQGTVTTGFPEDENTAHRRKMENFSDSKAYREFQNSRYPSHMTSDEKILTLREGDLLILNQRARHEIFPCGGNDIAVNFIILPEFFGRPITMIGHENMLRDFLVSTLTGSGESGYLLFHTKDVVPLENLLENLIWNMLVRRHGMNAINQTTMGLLFMNLSALSNEIRETEASGRSQTLLSVLEYIDKNYRDGTLTDAASRLGYSDYYLSRLLTNGTGKNFRQLLQQRKLQQAVYLLENTTLSADRIMEEIGYDNSSYFYRIFREVYGCTPKQYRKEHAVVRA